MAAFASASACPLTTLATIPRAKGSISQHKSLTSTIYNGFGKAQPETLKTMQNTVAKQLSIDVSSVTPETKFAHQGADSLDTVEIMMALEEKFGVSVGEGGAENIATVQDATDLIEKVKAAAWSTSFAL